MWNLGLVLLILQLGATRDSHQDVGEYRMPSPCNCTEGVCRCCTGFVLGQFGFNIQQKGCVNVMYDPDEFAFTMSLTFNNKELYKSHFTGKNPDPACVYIPRTNFRFCAVFSNVYFAGRNLHVCLNMKTYWYNSMLLSLSLDCIRVGANGVAVLKPEDGGGLPSNIFSTDDSDQDDYYDDL